MYRTPTSLPLIVLLSLTLGACGTAQDGHTFRTWEEDGVVHAVNTGGPKYEGDLFTLEPLLTLEEDLETPESMLFRVSLFAEGPDGRFYVVDSGSNRIAVFDESGAYVTSYGRRGSGPGEFEWMSWQGFVGDALSIFDSNLQRITRLGLDGELIEVITPPTTRAMANLERAVGGELLLFTSTRDLGERVERSSREVTVLSAGGQDTLAALSTPLEEWAMILRSGDGRSLSMFSLPFLGISEFVHVPSRGLLEVSGFSPHLAWWSLKGDLQRRVDAGIRTGPVTEELKERYLERNRTLNERSRAQGRPVRDDPDWIFPERRGIWMRPVVDDQGDIWLRDAVNSTLRLPEDPCMRHVISPEGEYLGMTPVPGYFISIRNGRLCGVVTDPDTGEETPTIFQVVPAVEGLVYP